MFRRVEDEALFEAHRQNISLQSAKYEEIFLERLSRWNEMLSSRCLSLAKWETVSGQFGGYLIRHYDTILNNSLRYRDVEFESPTLDMATLLPKDELANLAESLVSLTALHRKVSRDLETVGGAIDVAVISKGDGFVWIKRKHYFKPELNMHFKLNYLRNT